MAKLICLSPADIKNFSDFINRIRPLSYRHGGNLLDGDNLLSPHTSRCVTSSVTQCSCIIRSVSQHIKDADARITFGYEPSKAIIKSCVSTYADALTNKEPTKIFVTVLFTVTRKPYLRRGWRHRIPAPRKPLPLP